MSHANMKMTASKTIQKTRRSMNDKKMRLPDVTLRDNIPDVVRWVREQMDTETESSLVGEILGTTQNRESVSSARACAQQIMKKFNIRILLNDSQYWKGETRLWENICALCTKLPSNGRGNNVFDAMSRYPSSVLTYRGLKSLFGRHMVIAGEKKPRFSLNQNVYALFSPNASDETIAKKWFETNTFTRMQETAVHMCAISEYTLRCAYICKQSISQEDNEDVDFLSLLDERIKEDIDYRKRKVLRFETWSGPEMLSAGRLSECFERSANAAHDAVMEGAKVASRKYGRKEGNGRPRGKLKLWMLMRPLPDVMDALIQKLETVIAELLGDGVDVDEFRLRMTRHLRKVETIYRDIGSTWFSNETDFNMPRKLPRNTEFLVSSTPYTLCFR